MAYWLTLNGFGWQNRSLSVIKWGKVVENVIFLPMFVLGEPSL